MQGVWGQLCLTLGCLNSDIERDRFSEIDKSKVLEMFAQRKALKVKIYSHEEIKVDIFL